MHITKQLIMIIIMIPAMASGARFETMLAKDILSGFSGNISYMLSQSNNILEIGKEYDDLVQSERGGAASFHLNFNVKDLNSIHQFNLSQISFKDHATIKINDNLVWASANPLKLDTSQMFEEKIHDEDLKFYGLGGKSVETWQWHKTSAFVDCKRFLRQGKNQIEITLFYGKQGGFCSLWNVSQKAEKELQCQDGYRSCTSTGEKIVEGVRVTMPCWQYSYQKTCNYPSKNDCQQYASCTLIADRGCLLLDRYGNCVNIKREMSCEKPVKENYSVELVRFDLRDKNAATRLLCTNFPCIDGSCVNQNMEKNKEMMEVLSKLSAVGKAIGGDINARVFAGTARYCNNTRVLGYHDCCKIRGWGRYLGSLCSSEEMQLIDLRKQNKCIYVGKRHSKILGGMITTVSRNAWCCFNSILDKIVQQQGRQQLGKNFGTGDNPDCTGLSISEVLRLNFDQMDFSEFYADILKSMKLPSTNDIDQRLNNSIPDLQLYDPRAPDGENQKCGVNKNYAK